MLKELVTNGLIRAYPVGEMTMLQVVDWSQWQRIKEPTFQWPDESGSIPTRRKVGGTAAKAREKSGDPTPPAQDAAEAPPPKGGKNTAPKPRGGRRTPPTQEPTGAPDLAPFVEHIDLYAEGKWKVEWGNPPGLGCALPQEVQDHMTKDGMKPAEQLVIE